MFESIWNRRRFLKMMGTAAAASVSLDGLSEEPAGVAIAIDGADEVAQSKPAKWAVEQLLQALKTRGVAVEHIAEPQEAREGSMCIVVADARSPLAQRMLRDAGATVADKPEALGIVVVRIGQKRGLLVCGEDARGLVYALTELADLVRNAPDPIAAFDAVETSTEQPANAVRSMTRLFCSNVEDLPWYNDRTMWPEYFDTLATQRFNRFNLAFGIGYDFISKVTDAYFLFTYPFLLKVPGYDVRVPQLPDAERDRNLEMLKYIGKQCVMRGMEFHVGLWMHGYEWINSPNANYTIEGLDKSTHGAYCRDAVRMLLQEVPEIHGLTFRIHGESGVQEGSFDFWGTVFDGVKTCGRTVPFDMHAKGMSQQMIDVALATGLPVTMTPKFWGEHMGMPYHQADIRKIEKPRTENKRGLMALSDGTRSFLRYGYGDLLAEDRKWDVVHRIWPGTQRVLMWGDPSFAAAYSRAFGFCGSNGVEIQEPLSFKGRRGSGHAGSRCGYADASYSPRWDWQKYEYSTRLWGRMLYNPETKPDVWRRSMRRQFGPAAIHLETALANVSRILPIITTAHAPSAGNNTYWPELYLNQSMVDAAHYGPYGDSPEPRVFGNASAFDPELFLSMNECAEELLVGKFSGKYSPIEVAQWIEDFAAAGRKALALTATSSRGRDGASYRRAKVDIEIQAGLGEFFGAKFRSGVLFHLYELTHEKSALQTSISQYKRARAAWSALASAGKGVYMPDITLGELAQLRGHWLDRLPAIDQDIASLEELLNTSPSTSTTHNAEAAFKVAIGRPQRASIEVRHLVPERFIRGESISLALAASAEIVSVILHYRRVDQADNYAAVEMKRQDKSFHASIPAAYTLTSFPLEYYFAVIKSDGSTVLHPGFTPELTNQPYFVIRSV